MSSSYLTKFAVTTFWQLQKVITHIVLDKLWPRHITQGPNWFNRTKYTGSFDTAKTPTPVYKQYMWTWYDVFSGSFDSHQQKNNLVFHGIEPDKMEKDMAMVSRRGDDSKFSVFWRNFLAPPQEPDFCRDILETRIKMLLREHLKISRDISFFKVPDTSRHQAVTFFASQPFPKLQLVVAKLLWEGLKLNIVKSATSTKLKPFEPRWHECLMPQKMQGGLDL